MVIKFSSRIVFRFLSREVLFVVSLLEIIIIFFTFSSGWKIVTAVYKREN